MATRTAMTVGEVLLAVAASAVVVLLLLGLTLPMRGYGSGRTSQAAACANNLKGIATACLAYEQESGVVPIDLVAAAHDAHEARLVTIRAFARLAVAESLPDKLFQCPADRRSGPDRGVPAARDPIAWGGRADHHVAYAFDWSAPIDAGENRILLTDRSPRHGGDATGVMAVYADSHCARISCGNAGRIGGHHTEDVDGKPVGGVWSSVESPPTAEDSIYDDLGDDGDALTPGTGSATRAWVK